MKKLCEKCNNVFDTRANNYLKHINACEGNYVKFTKLISCRYCGLSFENLTTSIRANHSRWCEKNPKHIEYKQKTCHMREGITNESRDKQAIGIKLAHKNGKYHDSSKKALATRRAKGNLNHSEESKKLISQKSLASKHRRLVRNRILYKDIWLDSSWELILATRLDELNVKWIRPDPIKWVDDNGVSHNYFPDFYLVDYDLYLDPKNPQAYKVQKDKILKLNEQYDNIIILKTLNECKEFQVPISVV